MLIFNLTGFYNPLGILWLRRPTLNVGVTPWAEVLRIIRKKQSEQQTPEAVTHHDALYPQTFSFLSSFCKALCDSNEKQQVRAAYVGLSLFTYSFKQCVTQKKLSMRVENYINMNLVLLASACIHQTYKTQSLRYPTETVICSVSSLASILCFCCMHFSHCRGCNGVMMFLRLRRVTGHCCFRVLESSTAAAMVPIDVVRSTWVERTGIRAPQ